MRAEAAGTIEVRVSDRAGDRPAMSAHDRRMIDGDVIDVGVIPPKLLAA